MDSKVDLGKLPFGLCRLLPDQHLHSHSLQGQGNLVCSKNMTSFSLLSSCGTNFEGSPLSHEYLAIIPELPFPKIQLFSYAGFAELISHPSCPVCLPRCQSLLLTQRVPDRTLEPDPAPYCEISANSAIDTGLRINPFALGTFRSSLEACVRSQPTLRSEAVALCSNSGVCVVGVQPEEPVNYAASAFCPESPLLLPGCVWEPTQQTAAEYVKSRLPEALKQHLQDYEKDKENSVLSYQTILEQQILSIDREMLEKLTVSYDEAGTTCLIALLSDKDLTVANVGDSRGVLCDKDGNAIPLSHDHKPYQLKERKRIKRAGGFISFNGSWRVQGILAMSRSLGDYPLKNLNVVIPDPDILTFDLDKLQPEFMILASDGLWDAFSNEEAVRFIKERLDEPHFGAKSIVLQSFYRGCPDNITVMVVKFRNSSKTEEQ
uniref:Protein phosphatase 1L n=4 Tax=Boreoeutheria TaxID=1437010 RepID=A0A3Q2HD33_HORSE